MHRRALLEARPRLKALQTLSQPFMLMQCTIQTAVVQCMPGITATIPKTVKLILKLHSECIHSVAAYTPSGKEATTFCIWTPEQMPLLVALSL